jgi:hypothetical protein
MSGATICDKCRSGTLKRDSGGRLGRFLHVGCFNAWWKSEYGDPGGPYYRWMRQGMCAR